MSLPAMITQSTFTTAAAAEIDVKKSCLEYTKLKTTQEEVDIINEEGISNWRTLEVALGVEDQINKMNRLAGHKVKNTNRQAFKFLGIRQLGMTEHHLHTLAGLLSDQAGTELSHKDAIMEINQALYMLLGAPMATDHDAGMVKTELPTEYWHQTFLGGMLFDADKREEIEAGARAEQAALGERRRTPRSPAAASNTQAELLIKQQAEELAAAKKEMEEMRAALAEMKASEEKKSTKKKKVPKCPAPKGKKPYVLPALSPEEVTESDQELDEDEE